MAHKPQSPAPPESSTKEFRTPEPSSDANDLGPDYDLIDDDEVGLGCQKEVTEHELKEEMKGETEHDGKEKLKGETERKGKEEIRKDELQ